MKSMFKAGGILIASLALLTSAAAEIRTGVTSTISGVEWNVVGVSGPFIPPDCNVIQLDLTGDFQNSAAFTAYGGLKCSQGTYMISGSGYLSVAQTLSLGFKAGTGVHFTCDISLTTLYGQCNVSSISGEPQGTLRLTPRP